MWDLPLNSLRAFAAIYSTGGIRPAARKLGVTHSAVSRHLAELEAWLGVSLTSRGAGQRGLKFTVQGNALGEAALEGLRELATVASSVREARSEASVQLGTHPSFAVRWLLPRLPELEAAHPEIEVSVIVDRKLTNIDRSDLDLAVVMGPRRAADPEWKHLMGDELYPVMSPAYWAEHDEPSEPEGLVGLRLLHDRDPDASWGEWQSVHGPDDLDVRKGPRFTSTDLVLRAAAAGQGVALARHQLAVSDLESGHLIRPLGERSVVLETAYWIVVPSHKLPTPATRSVIRWLTKQATAKPKTRAGDPGRKTSDSSRR